jgi:prolipoprotein diacylglyceryltransferase
MIPAYHLEGFSIGPVRLHTFGLLLVTGIIAAHTALVRRARADGLARPAVVEGFAVSVTAGGIAAALIADRVVGLGLSSLFGVGGAIAAGAAYAGVMGLDVLRFADAGAWAFSVGWFFARMGCAAVHDHLGPASTSWPAVNFASGPRLDMGLLEWLTVPLLIACAIAARRGKRPGAVAGVVAIGYAVARFSLDFLRADDGRLAGLTAAQWGAVPLFAAGAVLLRLAAQGKPVIDQQR